MCEYFSTSSFSFIHSLMSNTKTIALFRWMLKFWLSLSGRTSDYSISLFVLMSDLKSVIDTITPLIESPLNEIKRNKKAQENFKLWLAAIEISCGVLTVTFGRRIKFKEHISSLLLSIGLKRLLPSLYTIDVFSYQFSQEIV